MPNTVTATYQTASSALDTMLNAESEHRRIRIDSDGNIAMADVPEHPFAKLIYAAKRFLYGDRDRASAMVAVLNKMKVEVAQTSAAFHKTFRQQSNSFEQLGVLGNINALQKDWTALIINAQKLTSEQEQAASRGRIAGTTGGHSVPIGTDYSAQVAPRHPQAQQSTLPRRVDAIASDLIKVYGMAQQEATWFAHDIHVALIELGISFRELRETRLLLLEQEHIPGNLSKKTEFSAAITYLQEVKKGKQPKDAASVIEKRLNFLPQIQQLLPESEPARIDCIHQGAIHRFHGEIAHDDLEFIKSLKSQSADGHTVDKNVLATYPLLKSLGIQFGKDFDRSSPKFRVNGTIDPNMAEATRKMKEVAISQKKAGKTAINQLADSKFDDAKNEWLEAYIKFFGDHANAATVASYCLSQTTIGSLHLRWMQTRDFVFSCKDEYKEVPLTVDMVGEGKSKRCVLSVASIKYQSELHPSTTSPKGKSPPLANDKFASLPLVTRENSAQSLPSEWDEVTLEFNVDDMKNPDYKFQIRSAKVHRNIELDWEQLDAQLSPSDSGAK